MAKIRVITQSPIYDGILLTFKAPCDCTEVDGLRVYYPIATENEKENVSCDFTFVDAHGETLAGLGNLFTENAYIRVILDTENSYAYLQNADTNAYLESQFECKTGVGEITYNDEYVGEFNYAVLGGVVQIRLETNTFTPNSSVSRSLRLVDKTGNLPSFSNGEYAEIQLNGYGEHEVEGNVSQVSQVLPALLSTSSWYMNVQDMTYVDSFCLKGTITLLDVPTSKG